MIRKNLSLTALLILMIVGVGYSHKCIHQSNDNLLIVGSAPEKNRVTLEMSDSTSSSSKTNAVPIDSHFLTDSSSSTSQKSPIRITIDSNELSQTDSTSANLISKALNNAQKFYEDLILVNKPNLEPISVENQECNGYKFNNYPSQSDSDMHFYLVLKQIDSDVLASSVACQLGKNYSNRPQVGVIMVNTKYLQTLAHNYYTFSKILKITIHEMFHALVFSPSLFSQFDIQGNTFVSGSLTISFPNVLQWAKDHYGCQDMTSLTLETHGSSGSRGSHWSRDLLHHDIMTASSILGNMVWSGINNALLVDSGWYSVTDIENKSERNQWGLNQGCSFLKTSQCSSSGANCELNAILNSFNYSGQGKCSGDDEFSTCPYVALYLNTECQNPKENTHKTVLELFKYFNVVFGSQSASFVSSLTPKSYSSTINQQILCYPQSCSSDFKKIYITFGETILTCSSDSQVISAPNSFTGTLNCPSSIYNFCQRQTQCSNYCSTNGYCQNGTCICLEGYSGDDCSCNTDSTKNEPLCNHTQVDNCILYDETAKCVKCNSAHSLDDNNGCTLAATVSTGKQNLSWSSITLIIGLAAMTLL